MNHNHNTTFKKLQQQQHDPSAMNRTFTPSTSPPHHASNLTSFTNANGEMMKKVWRSCGKKALMKFKLIELKEELRKKGCTLHGNKAEIVERLHEKYMSEEQPNALASSLPTSMSSNSGTSPESISSTSSLGSSPNSSISSSTTHHHTPQSSSGGLTKSASSGSFPSPMKVTPPPSTTHSSPSSHSTHTPISSSSNNDLLNEQRKSAYIKKNTSNTPVVTFAPFSAMMNNLQEMTTNSQTSSQYTNGSTNSSMMTSPSSSTTISPSTHSNMLLSPSVNRDALLSPPSRVSSAPPTSTMFTPHHASGLMHSFHPLYASMYSSAAATTSGSLFTPSIATTATTNGITTTTATTATTTTTTTNHMNTTNMSNQMTSQGTTTSNSLTSPSATIGSTNSPSTQNQHKTPSATSSSSIQLPPPPNISALPSSYSPLFYGAHTSKLPTYPLAAYKFNTPLQPISPYQTPYGMPYMNFSAFYNGPIGQTTKKKKKKKNTTNNSESMVQPSQELTQQVESSGFETDEFLSLEEIEYYNSNVDYNSSSDDHGNTSQKRCLSDTELYFDSLDSETYNLLYPQPTNNAPHKNKKQKQDHLNNEVSGYYDDLFYDNKDNLESQGTTNLTQMTETLNMNESSNVVHDIGFRVRLYIDNNSSDEKDVVVKDDKTWPEVVKQLINDYQPFYKSFLFDLPSDNFSIILHSKQQDEEKVLSEASTVLASCLNGSDSITITLKQTGHYLCRFNLEVDSITSTGPNLFEEDGYDQDNEDDDELELEESQQNEHNQEEMHSDQMNILNLIESM